MSARIRLVTPATIAGAMQFDLKSRLNGRTYRIYVYEPLHEPPPRGYPVVYVTDGNAFFCGAAMQAEIMELNAVIVGIGYPTTDRREPDVLRFKDLTWEAPSAEVAADFEAYLQSGSIAYGGAEEYFRFLKQQVEPAVAAVHALDEAKRTIFGDSLGGLFVLHLLFRYPGEFSTYVAGSPSIWWNDKAIVRELPEFRRMVESQQASPRVLITVGSLEEETQGLDAPQGMDRGRFEAMIRQARMVRNVLELSAQLALIQGLKPFEVASQVFEGETHQSVIGATLSRALRFALRT